VKLVLENWRSFLGERAYGNLIVAYSRTSRLSNIKSMLENGWRIGDYGDFGPAIYLVYDLAVSEYADRWYGTYIMKLAIKANNKFLIFDEETAKITYGSNSDLQSQVGLIDPKLLEDQKVQEWISSYAERMGVSSWRYAPQAVKDAVSGVLFDTGPDKDGKVAVVYKPENVLTMTSWAKIPEIYSVEKLPKEQWAKAAQAAPLSFDDSKAALLRLIEKYDGDVYKMKTNPPTDEELSAIVGERTQITKENAVLLLKDYYDERADGFPKWSQDMETFEEFEDAFIDEFGFSIGDPVDTAEWFAEEDPDFAVSIDPSADIKRFLNIRNSGARDYDAMPFDEYIGWLKKIGLDPQKRTEPYSRQTLDWNTEVEGIKLPQRIRHQ